MTALLLSPSLNIPAQESLERSRQSRDYRFDPHFLQSELNVEGFLLKSDSKNGKSDQWDSREREMERISKLRSKHLRRPNSKGKKFDPRKRFKFMLYCLGAFLFTDVILLWSLNNPGTIYQGIFSMMGLIFSGTYFAINYGKEVIRSLSYLLTKSSLR